MPDTAGYCGACGSPFSSGEGPFCGRCGNPIWAPPRAATGYTYPVLPFATVPGAQFRVGRRRLFGFGGGTLVGLVSLITLIAVLLRPGTTPCGLYCGPQTGPRLLATTSYTSSRFGYTVEYSTGDLTPGAQDASGIELDSADGDGSVVFAAASGSDVEGANQAAFAALPSSTFQNVQQVGPVRGAEIGFVDGAGTAYTADFAAPDGSGVTQVGIVIMSATQNDVTITVTAFSGYTNDNDALPYGIDKAEVFDGPISNTIWKGSS